MLTSCHTKQKDLNAISNAVYAVKKMKMILESYDIKLSTQECSFTSVSLIWQVTLVEFRKPFPCTVTFLHGRFRLSHNPLL